MKGNLLIVDDEVLIVERMNLFLEDVADKVFTAHNGKEAIKIVDNEEIHCIICDINMPVMNGLDVIKAIRAKNNQVPFIFYTGHGNVELMTEVIKYGAFDFLDKPNLDGLEDVVIRGLKAGLGKKEDKTNKDSYISEYQKLLDDIEG